MGLDMVRTGSRVPLLLALLSLLSICLIFNWWSQSTENLDLIKQVENLEEHLKSSANILDHCRRDRTSFENRVQTLEDRTEELVKSLNDEKQRNSFLEKSVKKQASDISDLEKKYSGAMDSLNICRAELDSLKQVDVSKDGAIATLRIEKGDLNNQIQELKDKITQLQNQLEQVKSAPAVLPAVDGSQLKSSTTAASPLKLEIAAAADDEPKNLPEPNHADTKEDHGGEKEDSLLTDVDPREKEMQDAPDEKKEV